MISELSPINNRAGFEPTVSDPLLPEELRAGWSQLKDPWRDRLTLHHRGRVDQLVLLEVPAGDPHGHGGLPGRDDNPDPRVPAASHGTTARVDHEADQEPEILSTHSGSKTLKVNYLKRNVNVTSLPIFIAWIFLQCCILKLKRKCYNGPRAFWCLPNQEEKVRSLLFFCWISTC